MNHPKTKGIVTFYSQDNSYSEIVKFTLAAAFLCNDEAVWRDSMQAIYLPLFQTACHKIMLSSYTGVRGTEKWQQKQKRD